MLIYQVSKALLIHSTLLFVAGSNEFAGSGANPIWQAAMDNEFDENDLQFLEEMSEYSGDSILIGVEDQTEFNDYKEKVEEADMDMELYNKMWGRYKKMDDYHANDKDNDENYKDVIVVHQENVGPNEADTYF